MRHRVINAEDLTGDITDSAARLRNLRRTEADIRKIMDRSGSVSQVLEAENQLSQVREQIETLQAELKSMQGRVAFASIAVDLQAEVSRVPVQPTALSQLASAWHAAVSALSQTTIGLVAALMWLLVFAPYVLVISALAAFAYVRRRRYAMR
jgi:DNA repair ATPase RecN